MACAVFLCGASLGGCTTVLVSENADADRAAAMERVALIAAADRLSNTPWPKPEPASLGARLTGGVVGGSRVSQGDAVTAYLARLAGEPAPASAVFTDAENHLGAAANLVDVADIAAASMRPARADIAILEEAIGDLRMTRDVYLASLKTLARSGDAVDDQDVRQLRVAFNAAIEEMGAAADRLAESVADTRARNFAEPAPRGRNFRNAF